jgi:hypothetical protein
VIHHNDAHELTHQPGNEASRREAEAEAEAEPEFFPRPDGEWQGMLVSRVDRQICQETLHCGMALACRSDGLCGPCEADGDCAEGEACVLDHCIPGGLVECRSRKDCAAADPLALCVLSGPTGNEPRGNSRTRSYCLSADQPVPGHEQQDLEQAEKILEAALRDSVYERPAVTDDDLLAILRSARQEGTK